MTDEEIRKDIAEKERIAKEKLFEQKLNKLLQICGITERFKQKTFSNFTLTNDNKDIYDKAQEFIKNFPSEKGILFFGKPGRGKTHLAAAITNHLLYELYEVVFGNVTNLISSIRSTYQKNSENTEADIINLLSNCDLLVIDDLGKENISENNKKIFYEVINNRYENLKPVLITTNLSLEEIQERYGEWTVSRLAEMCDFVKAKGEDWRFK